MKRVIMPTGKEGFPGLYVRNGRYYFRRKIPTCYRVLFQGKSEIKVSLKTSNIDDALVPAKAQEKVFQEKIAAGKNLYATNNTSSLLALTESNEVIAAICQLYQFSVLEGDDWYRPISSQRDLDERHANYMAALKELKQALARGNFKVIDQSLFMFLSLCLRVQVNFDAEALSKLRVSFLREAIRTQQYLIDRFHGEPIDPPLLSELALAINSFRNDEAVTLLKLLENWKNRSKNPVRKTLRDFKQTMESFVEFMGGNSLAVLVSRKNAQEFIDHLCEREGLAPRTLAKKRSLLYAMFDGAKCDGNISDNPFEKIRIAGVKKCLRERKPFSEKQLIDIFGSLQHGLAEDSLNGPDEFRWLPALALYTGARLEEIGQLLVDDIRFEDGIWFMSINMDDGEKNLESHSNLTGKHLKNRSSLRQVPLHHSLVDAGFIDHLNRLKSKNEKYVFPGCKPNRDGIRTAAFSKRWGRFIRLTVGIDDRRYVFHSFRHTFADALRRHTKDEELRERLLGHASPRGYSYGEGFTLHVLNEAIENIEFGALELPKA